MQLERLTFRFVQWGFAALSASIVMGGTPGWEDVSLTELKVVAVERPHSNPGSIRFVVNVTAGQSYSVESTLDPTLASWTSASRIMPQPKSGMVEIFIPEPNDGARFFRVVSPRVD